MAKENGKPKTIAQEAIDLVYGDRAKAYGHPKDNWGWTAKQWDLFVKMILATRFQITVEGEIIGAKEALRMMAQMKEVREYTGIPKRDNPRDQFGYLVCVERIDE